MKDEWREVNRVQVDLIIEKEFYFCKTFHFSPTSSLVENVLNLTKTSFFGKITFVTYGYLDSSQLNIIKYFLLSMF